MQPVESCYAANFYATFEKHYFFIKIALKLSYFCKKMQNFQALEAPPPDFRASGSWSLRPQPPLAFGGWRLRLQTQKLAPHCEFLATRLVPSLVEELFFSFGLHLKSGKKVFHFW